MGESAEVCAGATSEDGEGDGGENGAEKTVGASSSIARWKSISKHHVMCLECGQAFKQLSVRHLQDHDLDARAYRAKYGIPRTQALSANATTTLRKQLVQQSRLWEKAPTYQKAHPVQAQPTGRSKRKRMTMAKA